MVLCILMVQVRWGRLRNNLSGLVNEISQDLQSHIFITAFVPANVYFLGILPCQSEL